MRFVHSNLFWVGLGLFLPFVQSCFANLMSVYTERDRGVREGMV